MSTRRVFEALRSVVGGHDRRVLLECRHCGTHLDEDEDSCPACGATEIARFVV